MKYTIKTECTATSEYVVEADSKKQAIERFYDGQFTNETITDYRDESVVDVTEVEL